MELILKTNDEKSIAKILSLAKELHVIVEKRATEVTTSSKDDIEAIREYLLNFKADEPSSIKDPVKWQREQRKDRNLPFSK